MLISAPHPGQQLVRRAAVFGAVDARSAVTAPSAAVAGQLLSWVVASAFSNQRQARPMPKNEKRILCTSERGEKAGRSPRAAAAGQPPR
jgi:hypothetical protein